MTPPASARLLTPGDAHAYAELRREMLLDTPWAFCSSPEDDVAIEPKQAAARLGEQCNDIAGGFVGTHLLAAAGVRREPKLKMRHTAYIWGVYVSPAARGTGLGRSVMQLAIDTARSWPGIRSISLSASVRSTAAIALYESLGFVRWGLEPACMQIGGELIEEVHLRLAVSG